MELTPFTPYKLLKHSDRIAAMLRGDVVYPISVELDLSNICNHGCPWCSFNGFRQDNWQHFPFERVMSLLDELAECGVKSVTFTGGGEPLVHPQAVSILAKASAVGLEWGVVTNGRKLEGALAEVIAKHATFVRISLDAGTQQTHQLLHATAVPEYDRILVNMAKVVTQAARKTLTVGASFCVFDVNLHEIDEAAARVKSTGANYLEVRPVFPTEWRGGGFGNPLTAEHVDKARQALEEAKQRNSDKFRVIGMIQRFDQVLDKSKPYEKCQIGPLTTVINADGSIYHCCQMRGMADFKGGSILNRPFKDVWMSAQHRQMQDSIDVTKCPSCRYDGYNQILAEACQGDALHANFV